MILLLGLYYPHTVQRLTEINLCLQKNIQMFDKVIVLSESELASSTLRIINNSNVKLIDDRFRHTYAQFIEYANQNLVGVHGMDCSGSTRGVHGTRGETVILSNIDIEFTRLDPVISPGSFACITKFEGGRTNPQAWYKAQDSWGFIPPIPVIGDFTLGRPDCDRRIAWEARAAGLRVFNPYCRIVGQHHHGDQSRTYRDCDRVHGPILYVMNTTI